MPDFSLLQSPNFAQSALSGYQAGRAMGRQQRTDAALAAYGKDPDAGIKAASSFDPALGKELSDLNRDTKARDALSRVYNTTAPQTGATPLTAPTAHQAGGQLNQAALADLARYDPQQAMAIQKFAQTASKEQFDMAANHAGVKAQGAAYLMQFPEGPERVAALQRIAPQLQSYGFRPEELAQARLDDASLKADQAFGLSFKEITDNARDDSKIVWHQQGEQPSFATNGRGVPVGNANPYAGNRGGVAPRPVSSKSDYDALPPGASYIAPDGSQRVKGGAAQSGTATFPDPMNGPGRMTSGRRTVAGNAAVGGVPNSAHLRGDAFDVTGTTEAALRGYYGPGARLLNEGDHIHVTLPGYGRVPLYGKRGAR